MGISAGPQPRSATFRKCSAKFATTCATYHWFESEKSADDFAHAPVVKFIGPPATIDVDVNAWKRNLESVSALYRGDLFAPLQGKRYDLILSNPPYVDARAMARLPAEYRHEPRLALAAGDDGLDLVRRILAEAPKHLAKDGALICEIGRGRRQLEAAFPDLPFLWLDTEQSEGEVFWIERKDLVGRRT